jgi:hypothetical protein
MNAQELIDTAKTLVAGDKGLLAMDESNPTCNKRFAKLGIPQTEEARRAYRELIVTTPVLGECIGGAILYDETIRQQSRDRTLIQTPARTGPHAPAESSRFAVSDNPLWRSSPRTFLCRRQTHTSISESPKQDGRSRRPPYIPKSCCQPAYVSTE